MATGIWVLCGFSKWSFALVQRHGYELGVGPRSRCRDELSRLRSSSSGGVSSAAGLVRLDGGARHAAVRAEDTAVSLHRAKGCVARRALPKELAAVCGHLRLGLRPTLRTRDGRGKNGVRHGSGIGFELRGTPGVLCGRRERLHGCRCRIEANGRPWGLKSCLCAVDAAHFFEGRTDTPVRSCVRRILPIDADVGG